MKRYSIIVREYGGNKEVELCAVDSNPEAVLDAVREKYLLVDGGVGRRRISVPKYEHSYIRENQAKGPETA